MFLGLFLHAEHDSDILFSLFRTSNPEFEHFRKDIRILFVSYFRRFNRFRIR